MTAVILIALAALLIGVLLVWGGRRSRQSHGLTDATTLDLDRRTLYSRSLGLAGRPDRLVRDGEFVIPEEWKGSRRVYDSHRAQIAVYFLLIEEEYGVRPPYGVIVTGDGRRERVENTPEIRAWVLGISEQIRAARARLAEPIRVNQPAGKCRACGMREGCGQRFRAPLMTEASSDRGAGPGPFRHLLRRWARGLGAAP